MGRTARGLCLGLLILPTLFIGCSRNRTPPVPETADQAVLQITEGLADGRPQVVWHALPASYQQDVTELIHDFGGKMDAEVWNRSFGVMQKLTRVLDDKREYILDHPMLTSKIDDRKKADEVWDAVIGMLETLTESELADLDRVKKLDVERFLSGTGAELADHFKELEALAPNQASAGSLFGLSDARATLISSEGDRARLRVEVPGKPATEEDYVRVEGKWIPAKMATEWDRTVAEARAKLAGFSGDEMRQNKQTYLMQLSMVEGALDQLLATESAAQFQTAVSGLVGMAMGAVMAQAQKSSSILPQEFSSPSPPSLDVAAQTPPARVPVQAPSASPGSVESYLGKEVRVTERDGYNTDGYLVKVTDDLLFVEKRIGHGSLTVEFSRARIARVEPIRQ